MVRWRAGAVIWMLAVVAVCAEGLTPVQYREQRQFADGLYSRKMYELAAREYTALLQTAPGGAENDIVEFRLGECLRLQGKLKEAAERFSHLYVTYPKSEYRLRSAFRRARLYMETDQHSSAVEHFRAILKEPALDPSLASAARFYLADSLAELKRNGEALAAFGELTRTQPDSVFIPYARMREAEVRRRGLAGLPEAKRKQEMGRILGLYTKVLEGPKEGRLAAEALFQMAELHFRAKEYRQSAEFYRRLLREYADDRRVPEARLQAAWSATHAGLHADALGIAKQALAGDVGSARVEWLYLMANCQRLLSELDGAVASYRQVLAADARGRFAEAARYEMALTHMKQGNYADAVEAAEAIGLTSALRLDVAWLLAESYKELGQHAKAIQYYRIVEKEAPEGQLACDATYRLAYTLQQQESWREASGFYNRLVERFPANKAAAQALFASAVCLHRVGDFAGAARDWTRLSREYKADALVEESLYQAAMAQMRLEAGEAAAALLDELIRSHGKGRYGADARYWRGMLWKRAGKLDEAATLLGEAMATGSGDIAELARYNLALAKRELGEEREAASLLEPLLARELANQFPAALVEWLSEYYFAAKQYAQAADAAKRLVASHKQAAWQQAGWCLRGRAEAALGHTDAAREAFSEALRQPAPTEYGAEAALRLGDLELELKTFEAARQHYQQAITLASSEQTSGIRARAFFGVGRASALAGDLQSAARSYMMVAILYDDPALVPEALFGAVEAFLGSEMETDARDAAAELAQRYPDSPWTSKARERLAALPAMSPEVPDEAAGASEGGSPQ